MRTADYGIPTKLSGLLLDTYARINGQIAPRPDAATNQGAVFVQPGAVTVDTSPYYSLPPGIVPLTTK